MSSAVAAKNRGQGSEAGGQRSEISGQRSEGTEPSTLAALCLEAIARHNKPDAVSEKRGDEWARISSAEFGRRVRHIALGLSDLGIRAGDRVALISENRPEWSIADLAILSIGAVTVPIYTTQAVDQIQFILTDSGARALMISGGKILKHAREGFAGMDQLEHVVVFDTKSAADVRRATTLETIEARGATIESEDFAAFDKLVAGGRGDDRVAVSDR